MEFYGSSFFLETKLESEPLEPLIAFLMFVVETLGPKNKKLYDQFPREFA